MEGKSCGHDSYHITARKRSIETHIREHIYLNLENGIAVVFLHISSVGGLRGMRNIFRNLNLNNTKIQFES